MGEGDSIRGRLGNDGAYSVGVEVSNNGTLVGFNEREDIPSAGDRELVLVGSSVLTREEEVDGVFVGAFDFLTM